MPGRIETCGKMCLTGSVSQRMKTATSARYAGKENSVCGSCLDAGIQNTPSASTASAS